MLKMKKIQKFLHKKLPLFLGLFFGILISGSLNFLGFSTSYANAGENFLFLKAQVEKEMNLSQLGQNNKKFLTFKAFEYEESKIFWLGALNKKFLTEQLDAQKNYSSYENAIGNSVHDLAEIDIWDYLAIGSVEDDKKGAVSRYGKEVVRRENRLEEYLFLAKNAEKNGTSHAENIENSLQKLKTEISYQSDIVENLERNFQKILESQDENLLVKAKYDLVQESKTLKQLQIEYSEKKYQYYSIVPSLKNLKNKIQAIEENRDALVKNVKTKKYSGEYIKAVVE